MDPAPDQPVTVATSTVGTVTVSLTGPLRIDTGDGDTLTLAAAEVAVLADAGVRHRRRTAGGQASTVTWSATWEGTIDIDGHDLDDDAVGKVLSDGLVAILSRRR